MKKISICVVDDHKLIREMWYAVFSGNSKMEVTGESGTLKDAIELAKNTRPDILLLDINLPDGSGIDAVPLIRKYSPGTKIISVSLHNQPVYAKKMLKVGAKGYVTKNSSHYEIFKAIETVIQGQIYICAEIKDILSNQTLVEGIDRPRIKDLSLREIEIIKLLKNGLSSKEIGAELSISARTVDAHKHNIFKKLSLKNATSLINFINTSDFSF